MDALTAIISILYPFWLLIPLLGLRPLFKKDQPFFERFRMGVRDIFLAWMVWALLWRFIIWRDRKPIMILTESVNNTAFLMLGAIIGAIYLLWTLWRWRNKRIRLSHLKTLEDLMALSPEAFERLVAKVFAFQGYQVNHVGGTSDHGVDIIVKNAQGERWIVQCKRYRGSVGEPVLRDLYGTLLHEGASGAYLITTGTFTQGAKDWADGKPIILQDGEEFVNLIHETSLGSASRRL